MYIFGQLNTKDEPFLIAKDSEIFGGSEALHQVELDCQALRESGGRVVIIGSTFSVQRLDEALGGL